MTSTTISRRHLLAIAGSAAVILAKPSQAQTPTPLDPRPQPIMGLPTRQIGNPQAPHVVTEWFSLTCAHCAAYQKADFPDIKKNLIDTGQLLYVFAPFPMDKVAITAELLARSLPEDKYLPFIDTIMQTQDSWAYGPRDPKELLVKQAEFAGMSEQEAKAALDDKELMNAIVGAAIFAQHNGVTSTPTFVFANGKTIVGESSLASFKKTLGL